MQPYIVLRRVDDWEQIKQEAQTKQRPRDYILLLEEKLKASLILPHVEPSNTDKLLSVWEGKPENWALARKLSHELDEDDIVFCDCEDSATPIATLFAHRQNRPTIVAFFQNFTRLRGLASTKLLRVSRAIDLFIVCSTYQRDRLRQHLNLPESQVRFIPFCVDFNFFSPGSSAKKIKPMIASVGLENRDYRLLALATEKMDVDVRISGVSPHAKQLKRSFPKVLPDNMSRRFYAWNELVQLYRDADIVVVSSFESNYASGITSLQEAVACKRPIIATKTRGLSSYLQTDAILTVEPGDVEGLKQAISYLLKNPEEARERAERAYQIAVDQYSVEHFTNTVVDYIKDVHSARKPK